MSWSFSLGLVAAFSEACYSGIDPCAQSSSTPTPDQFYWPDKPTEHSRISRFGMTCEPLTGNLGAELLTWYLAGFPVRTSASQEKARDLTEREADCGEKWPVSLARFDPASSSWKTAQPCLLGDSDECSPTWPRSGMTAGGQCWELPTLGRPTAASDSGLWPTPTCPNGGRSVAHVTDWRSERTAYTADGKKVQVDLAQAVKRWATPTVCGNYNRAGASPTSGDGLATQAGGALNPMWVEWLMGWPLGWTDLKLSATDKCQSAQPQPGACSLVE